MDSEQPLPAFFFFLETMVKKKPYGWKPYGWKSNWDILLQNFILNILFCIGV